AELDDDLASTTDVDEFEQLAARFHHTVAVAAAGPHLHALLRSFSGLVPAATRLSIVAAMPNRRPPLHPHYQPVPPRHPHTPLPGPPRCGGRPEPPPRRQRHPRAAPAGRRRRRPEEPRRARRASRPGATHRRTRGRPAPRSGAGDLEWTDDARYAGAASRLEC